MLEQLRVEPDEVALAGVRLDEIAAGLGGLDLAGPLRAAAGALPGSDTAWASGRLEADLTGTGRALVAAVQAMGAAAARTAGSYRTTDRGAAQLFQTMTAGLLPAAGLSPAAGPLSPVGLLPAAGPLSRASRHRPDAFAVPTRPGPLDLLGDPPGRAGPTHPSAAPVVR